MGRGGGTTTLISGHLDVARREETSLGEFADIWYPERTWRQLKKIEIRN